MSWHLIKAPRDKSLIDSIRKAQVNCRLPKTGAEWVLKGGSRYAVDFSCRYLAFGVGLVHVVYREVV